MTFWHTGSLIIEQRNQVLRLIPNVSTNIDPLYFIMDPITESESDIFKIKVTCSKEIEKHVFFEPVPNFCKGIHFVGTIFEINKSMQEITGLASLLFLKEIEAGFVTYIISSDFQSKILSKKVQLFNFEKRLRFFVEKDVIHYDSRSSQNLNEQIGHFESKLLVNRSVYNFTINDLNQFSKEHFQFKIMDNLLVLSGIIPKQFEQNLEFRLVITDNDSGLETDFILVSLVFTGTNKINKAFLLYSISGLLVSVFAFVFALYCVLQNPDLEERVLSQNYSCLPKNQKVLTESITDWTESTQYMQMRKQLKKREINNKGYINESNFEIEALRSEMKSENLIKVENENESFEEQGFDEIKTEGFNDISCIFSPIKKIEDA